MSPASVAALPRILDGGLPHAMRWRADDVRLYHLSDTEYTEVFANGLRPQGNHLGHLIEHVYRNPADTGYVSTSRNISHDPAGSPRHGYQWRYDVRAPGGVDVNATLDFASPFPGQDEVVFPGGIDARFIRGAQQVVNGSPTGPYIVNPAFDPDGLRNTPQAIQ
jgi:hypothetical protein